MDRRGAFDVPARLTHAPPRAALRMARAMLLSTA
jgi:hypothetical protein